MPNRVNTMPVDPKDIGKTIFEAALYEGELREVFIEEWAEGDKYGNPGEQTLVLRMNLVNEHGRAVPAEERLRMFGPGAFVASKACKSLGLVKNQDIPDFTGTKIRVEYAEPRKTDNDRIYNSFREIWIVQ